MGAKAAFKSYAPVPAADPLPRLALTPRQKRRLGLMKRRPALRIGIPRILNMYSVNPIGYFLKRYPEGIIQRKEKRAEIEAKLKEFEARLRAELEALPVVAPPPEPYEMEMPVGINAIRREG